MRVTRELSRATQVARELRARMSTGELAPGQRLASVRELAAAYGVSTQVIVDAMTVLAAEGLLIRRHGSGVFVRAAGDSEAAQCLALLTTYRGDSGLRNYFESLSCVCAEHGIVPSIIHASQELGENRLGWIAKSLRARPPREILLDIDHNFFTPDDFAILSPIAPVRFVNRWGWERTPPPHAVVQDEVAHWRDGFRFLAQHNLDQVLVIGHHEFDDPATLHQQRGAKAAGMVFPSARCHYFSLPAVERWDAPLAALLGDAPVRLGVLAGSDYLAHRFRACFEEQCPGAPPPLLVGAYDTEWSRLPGSEFSTFSFDYEAMWQQVLSHPMVAGADSAPIYLPPTFIKRGNEPTPKPPRAVKVRRSQLIGAT